MAIASHERAKAINRSFSDDDLDRPAFPLKLNRFDLIAEIKNRSPAEGELATATESRTDRARSVSKDAEGRKSCGSADIRRAYQISVGTRCAIEASSLRASRIVVQP